MIQAIVNFINAIGRISNSDGTRLKKAVIQNSKHLSVTSIALAHILPAESMKSDI